MDNPVFATNTAIACRAAALAGEGVALLTDFATGRQGLRRQCLVGLHRQ